MEQLLDKMYAKRFCLPVNYTYENNSNHDCICMGYNHIACVFQAKGKDR